MLAMKYITALRTKFLKYLRYHFIAIFPPRITTPQRIVFSTLASMRGIPILMKLLYFNSCLILISFVREEVQFRLQCRKMFRHFPKVRTLLGYSSAHQEILVIPHKQFLNESFRVLTLCVEYLDFFFFFLIMQSFYLHTNNPRMKYTEYKQYYIDKFY